MLSRITWPKVAANDATSGIADAYTAGKLKRACLQVVHSGDSLQVALRAVEGLRGASGVPVCVSSYLETVAQAQQLVAAGVERVCIALDGATPAVHMAAKEGDWSAKWRLLTECAEVLPGRVTTHLIVGLGESEEEMVDRLAVCVERGITVGLFAFTPVKGTAWGDRTAPPLAQYRRIQAAYYLLRAGYGREVIRCRQGRIIEFILDDPASLLIDGKAFQTSGCPDCNRPYYNERPGGVMYNYPGPLTADEAARAIAECEVIEVYGHAMADSQ